MLGRLLWGRCCIFLWLALRSLAFSAFFAPNPSRRQSTRIVVDSNQVMRLAAQWQRARRRLPTAQELN